jgi:hypothetical protein
MIPLTQTAVVDLGHKMTDSRQPQGREPQVGSLFLLIAVSVRQVENRIARSRAIASRMIWMIILDYGKIYSGSIN